MVTEEEILAMEAGRDSQVLRIIFNQSSTVCRLAKKVEEMARVRQNLEAQLKEYRDWKRLMERGR